MPKRPGKPTKRVREDEAETSATEARPAKQPTRRAPPTSRGPYKNQKYQALSKGSDHLSEHHPGTPNRTNKAVASQPSASPSPSESSSRGDNPACESLPDLTQLPLKAIPRKYEPLRDSVCVAALIEFQDKLEKGTHKEGSDEIAGENTEDSEEDTEDTAEDVTIAAVEKSIEEKPWCKCERGDVEGCSGSVECEDPRCKIGWYHWGCLSDLERELAKTWRIWLCRPCWERRAEEFFTNHPGLWVDDFDCKIPDSEDLEDRINQRVDTAIENDYDWEPVRKLEREERERKEHESDESVLEESEQE